MKCPSYNIFFETISTPIRLQIIDFLNDGAKNVTEICNHLNEEQSKISHNLKSLAGCHLLIVEKRGKHRYYSLNEDTVVPLLRIVEEHVAKYCCGECKVTVKAKR
ncbi:winged helix-turn-helix transcriptional regulator [Candidatus Woesearchaeota archaeon]|nr:winged helix-turn-helix transcriptional regulator [Candidatus Woesearchaeota archaeon]